MRVDLEKRQISAVLNALRDELGDDEQLKLDTLEGETNLYELVSTLLNDIEDAEMLAGAIGGQVKVRQERKQRLMARAAAHREAVQALMQCADLSKLELPEATLSVRKIAPKLIVTDAEKIPAEFMKLNPKPDMARLKAAEGHIEGTSYDNGGVSLTVRRK